MCSQATITMVSRPLSHARMMPPAAKSKPSLPTWALDPATWMPRNLDLEITAHCNLHCKYCYLEHRTSETPPVGHMTMEVAEQVLKYIEMRAKTLPPKGHVSLCLFGGEPFLNFEVVQYLISEADKRGLPTGRAIFTNGATAKPDQIKWCQEHKIISKRSVGGCPEACAFTRPGKYLENYLEESKLWNDYHRPRRITTIPETAKFLMDSVRYFYAQGFWGSLDFSTDDYAEWSAEAMQEYKDQTTRLAREFIRQFRLGHVLGNEVLQLYGKKMYDQSKTMTIGCGAGWGLQGITWDGYIVACHRYLREPRNSPFCGGPLADVLAGKPATFGEILRDHIFACASKQEALKCSDCVARQCCQHGCRHLSWSVNKDLDNTPEVRCEFTRHWRRLAVWTHQQLQDYDPPWYERKATKCAPIPEYA